MDRSLRCSSLSTASRAGRATGSTAPCSQPSTCARYCSARGVAQTGGEGCEWGPRSSRKGQADTQERCTAALCSCPRPPCLLPGPPGTHLQARLHVVRVQHNSHTQEVHHRCLRQGGAVRCTGSGEHRVGRRHPERSDATRMDPGWGGSRGAAAAPPRASTQVTCMRASSSANDSAW